MPKYNFRFKLLIIKQIYFTYQKADTINYQPNKLINRNNNLSDSSKTNNRIILIVARFADSKVRKNARREKRSFFTNSNTDSFNLAEIVKPKITIKP